MDQEIVGSPSDIEEAYFVLQNQLSQFMTESQFRITNNNFADVVKNEAFRRLLANLNITFLMKTLPSYEYQDRALLIAIRQLQKTFEVKLEEKGHHGKLLDVGSTVDQTKVNALDEVDMLFVVGADRGYVARRTEKKHVYHVSKSSNGALVEIRPRDLRRTFAQDISDIIDNIELPEGLVHSGYCSPQFSGVRYNGPAATMLMIWEDTDGQRQISVDITLVLELPPKDEQILQHEIMQKFEQLHTERKHDISRVCGIHLFPNPLSDRWELSTAGYEAYILEKIPRETPFKMCIQLCKAISSKLSSLPAFDKKDEDGQSRPIAIESTLIKHLLSTTEKQSEKREFMKYGHAFLTRDSGKQFNEMTKKAISINSAAIKHIAFHSATKREGAFIVNPNTEDLTSQLILYLMVDVFGYLSTDKKNIEHFFLGSSISLLSISTWASQCDHIGLLVDILKSQCLQIANILHKGPCVMYRVGDDVDIPQKCTVPAGELEYAEDTFNVNACFRGENCNEIFTAMLKMINALGNSLGGIIIVQDDSHEIRSADRDTWKSAFNNSIEYYGIAAFVSVQDDSHTHHKLRIRVRRYPNITNVPLYSYSGIQAATDTRHTDLIEETELHDHSFTVQYESYHIEVDTNSGQRKVCQRFARSAPLEPHDNNAICPDDAQSATTSDISDIGPEGDENVAESYTEFDESNKSNTSPDLTTEMIGLTLNQNDISRSQKVWQNRCTKLSWTTNQKDWERNLGEASKSLDINVSTIVSSADTFLKLSTPPSFIPSKPTILREFGKHPGFQDALMKLEKMLGDADALIIVSRNLPTSFQGMNHVIAPDQHMVDVLAIDSNCNIHIWCFLVCFSGTVYIKDGWEYLMKLSLSTKERLSGNRNSSVEMITDISIQSRLVCLPVTEQSSSVMPPVKSNLSHILTNLAAAFLQRESIYKDRFGHDIGIYLTAKQIEAVITSELAPISFVEGPPGSGKTYVAFHLCSKYKRVNYICSTATYKAYLDFQKNCTPQLIANEKDLKKYTKHGFFGNYDCIIIDDAHQLVCSYKTWASFFLRAREHSCQVYIFSDSRYQNFMQSDIRALKQCVKDLSENDDKAFHQLLDIHRNTRKVVSFLTSCAEDQANKDHDVLPRLRCSSQIDGDDVEIRHMKNIFAVNSGNELVKLVQSLTGANPFLGNVSQYEIKDVAVLFDTSNPVKDAKRFLQICKTSTLVHDAGHFPVYGITIDTLDNFMGFDRHVCICVTTESRRPSLRPSGRTIRNPKYRAFVASRGVSQVVFVTDSKMDVKMAEVMKMDKLPLQPSLMWESATHDEIDDVCWISMYESAALMYTTGFEVCCVSLKGSPLDVTMDTAHIKCPQTITNHDDRQTIIVVDRIAPYSWTLYQRYGPRLYIGRRSPQPKITLSVRWASDGGVLALVIKNDVEYLQKYLSTDGQLIWELLVDTADCKSPGALATDHAGRIYLVGTKCVQVFSPDGDPIKTVAVPDDFPVLAAVCVDSAGKWMFIADDDWYVSVFHNDRLFEREFIQTAGAVRCMSLCGSICLAIGTERGVRLYNVQGILL